MSVAYVISFVCTTAKDAARVTRLRSYSLRDELEIPATICDAALATLAATSFFSSVSIGPRCFVDSAPEANNPVEEVEDEASNIWCSEIGALKPLLKCFVSIGTGHPGTDEKESKMSVIDLHDLLRIASGAGNTERRFVARWAQHFNEIRYFRFNVEKGLQRVGLAEHKRHSVIERETDEYLQRTEQRSRVRDCVLNLRHKQSMCIETSRSATLIVVLWLTSYR